MLRKLTNLLGCWYLSFLLVIPEEIQRMGWWGCVWGVSSCFASPLLDTVASGYNSFLLNNVSEHQAQQNNKLLEQGVENGWILRRVALFQKKENLCILSQFIWLSKLALWVWRSHSPFPEQSAHLWKVGIMIKALSPSKDGRSDQMRLCLKDCFSATENALSSLASSLLFDFMYLYLSQHSWGI